MLGVSSTSAADAWAVGYADSGDLPTAVVQHWDGAAWSAVDSHAPGSNNAFYDVAALAGSDAWVVGDRLKSRAASSVALAEHWDGATWTPVTTAALDVTYANLLSVSAVDSNDVWAVGGTVTGSAYLPLVEHWDGTSWQTIAAPSGGSALLTGVSALSDDDVWAVGDGYVEHWDGTSWSSTATGPYVYDVSALAPDDVWVVGLRNLATFAEHWDGTSWSVAATPGLRGHRNEFTSVQGLGADDVWAVGYQKFKGSLHTLTEHWDGSTWSRVRSPNAPGVDSTLAGVGGDAGGDVWAVGTSSGTGLAEHWTGRRWHVTPLG